MDTWLNALPPSAATDGFKDVQNRAMELATENAESAFAFAGKISNAQSVQEILTLQTQFTQDRMQAFVAHTREFYSLLGDVIQKTQRG